jgi:hypothetical protein
MAGNICDSQARNDVASADSKVVDVATLAPFTGCGVNRPDDFSGRNFDVAITDASPNSLTLEPGLRINSWEL